MRLTGISWRDDESWEYASNETNTLMPEGLKKKKEEEKEFDAVFDDIAKIGTECREAI